MLSDAFRDITPIMENHMEKNMEHEMETGIRLLMDEISHRLKSLKPQELEFQGPEVVQDFIHPQNVGVYMG